jgi:methionine-S-sulfoxide reductase
MSVPTTHFVNGNPLKPPFPNGMETALFGLGCFWGAERKFWQQNGVFSTAVGYAAGITPNPTYNEVCSGMTGHNEVVLVVFDPKVISYETLLKICGNKKKKKKKKQNQKKKQKNTHRYKNKKTDPHTKHKKHKKYNIRQNKK